MEGFAGEFELAGTGAVGAITASTLGASAAPSSPKVLLAYFSRAGWNYHNGGRKYLQTGNTEVLAGIISQLIGCDVHRIEAAEPRGARVAAGLAIRGEEVNDARTAVGTWLRQNGLTAQ